MISGSSAACEIFRKTSVYNSVAVDERVYIRSLSTESVASQERSKMKEQHNDDLPEIICFREKLDRTGKQNENARRRMGEEGGK